MSTHKRSAKSVPATEEEIQEVLQRLATTPATPEDIQSVNEQLEQTCNDPNLTIRTETCFDIKDLDKSKNIEVLVPQKNQAKEALVSITCYEDPEVRKTAAEINSVIEKNTKSLPVDWGKKATKVKAIRPIGRERGEVVLFEETPTGVLVDNIRKMENEALEAKMLDDQTMKTIKDLAMKNPITKQLVEDAKKFTEKNKDEIKKQFNDLVAFYNIAHNKAFFYITAAEARMAIDYIKKTREGYVLDIENQEKRDAFVYEFMKTIVPSLLNDASKATDASDQTLCNKIQNDIDLVCGLEMNEIANPRMDRRKMPEYNPIDAFINTINKLEGFNFDEATKKRLEDIEKEELPKYFVYDVRKQAHNFEFGEGIGLTFINELFSVVEREDLTVDVILMNAKRIADVRNFGKTVYDEYSKKEFMRRRVFGQLFTAEIYPCNNLSDNQVIFGSLNLMPNHGVFVNTLIV